MSPTGKKRGALAEMRHVYRMLSMRAREIWLLVGLAVLFAVFEGIGVGMLAPVLQYIEYGPKAIDAKSLVWKYLLAAAGFLHLPVGLGSLLVLAFIPIILRMIVYFVNSWYSAEVAQRAATRLRSKGFETLVHSDLAFVVREGLGNLVSSLTAQVMRGSQAMQQFIQQISTGLLIVMYVIVLLALSVPLTGITIVAMLFISWVVSGNITRSRRLGREAADRNDETFTVVSERISAIRLIKMLGQERAETDLITDVVRRLEEVQVRIAISRGIVQVTVEPALMLALFVVIFVGVTMFHTPLATIGLFMYILLRLNDKATTFNAGRQNLSANVDSLEAVYDLIDRAAAARTIRGGRRKFEHLERGIEFRGVSFTYDDGDDCEPVLRDIEITIPKGAQIALVGRSGAGKSTLADLVPHLREATSGNVLIDGVPIGEYDLVSLRRGIGFMTQEALLFNDTIYNNLVYGLERVPTSEEIDDALRKAFCTEFVAELPEGLETNVGDRGVRLSGGQRQRLSLARVFLADPDIFILDEPTSALDSESEEYIQKALQSVHGTKTLIVIAHRLSTIQRSDEILVLDKGCILERGTHQELLDLEGSYRRLFELQIYQ